MWQHSTNLSMVFLYFIIPILVKSKILIVFFLCFLKKRGRLVWTCKSMPLCVFHVNSRTWKSVQHTINIKFLYSLIRTVTLAHEKKSAVDLVECQLSLLCILSILHSSIHILIFQTRRESIFFLSFGFIFQEFALG